MTLALRTLPSRPRGWLLGLLHSRLGEGARFPPLAFGLYVLSPWALYFSGWYAASLRSAYVHEMMIPSGPGRRALLLGRSSGWTRSPDGSATPSACC